MNQKNFLTRLLTKIIAVFLIALLAIIAGLNFSTPTSLNIKSNNSPKTHFKQLKTGDISAKTYQEFADLIINSAASSKDNPLFRLMQDIYPQLHDIDEIAYPNDAISFDEWSKQNVSKNQPQMADDLYFYNAYYAGGWTLKLSASNWNNLDLAYLSAFAYLTNIDSIILCVEGNYEATSFDIESIKKLNLINMLPNVRQLQIKIEDSASLLSGVKLSFDMFSFLENAGSNFKLLDISSFLGPLSTASVFQDIPINQDWYFNMNYGFRMWLPINLDIPKSTYDDYSVKKMENFLEVEKLAGLPMPLPTNEKHDPIMIDDKEIEAMIYENNWYWMLDDVNTLLKVAWYIPEEAVWPIKGYFTEEKYFEIKDCSEKQIISRHTQTYPQELTANFLEAKKVSLPEPTIELNAENIEAVLAQEVNIDNEIYKYHIEGSVARLDYDFKKNEVNYATINQEYYFTSIKAINDSIEKGIDPYELKVSSAKKIDDQYQYSPVMKLDLPMPKPNEKGNPEPNILILDNKIEIKPLINDGNFYWDFQNLDSENLKYYSPSLNEVFTSGKNIASASVFPSDIFELNPIADLPTLRTVPKDPGELTWANQKYLDNVIRVDSKDYGVILSNGRMYWDYPIENIQFIALQDLGGQEVSQYFTSYDQALAWAGNYQNVYSAKKMVARTYGRPKKIPEPTFASSITSISIDGGNIGQVIRNGKIYWDDAVSLNKIKYVDQYGLYFTTLGSSADFNHIGRVLTEVEQNKDGWAKPPAKFKSIYSQIIEDEPIIDNSNYDIWIEPIFIDGYKYQFKFLDSKVLLNTNLTSEIKYALNFTNDRTNEFLTQLEDAVVNIPTTTEAYSFDVPLYDEDTKFPILTNPQTKQEDPLIFMNDVGKKINISPNEDLEKGLLGWDNPIVAGANYVVENTKGETIYVHQLNKITMQDVVKISSLIIDPKIIFIEEEQQLELKRHQEDVALYVTIAIVGALAILVITKIVMLIWKIKRGK